MHKWRPDEDAILCRLWDAGIFVAAICARLDKTRGQVAGRAHRLGLPRRDHAPPRPKSLSQTPKAVRARARRAGISVKEQRATEAPVLAPVAPPEPLPVFIMAPPAIARPGSSQPRWGLCQYPSGDDRPYRWCGAPAVANEPYCRACRARCWQVPPRERAA